MKIKFSRWPGQPQPFGNSKYGWRHKSCGIMGRFGGGWRWKLGIEMGSSSLILNLIFGIVRISWNKTL